MCYAKQHSSVFIIRFIAQYLLSLLLVLSVCFNIPAFAQAPIKVVTTTGLLADAVNQISSGHVEVESLMGPGVDPHLYKASHGDLIRLRKADIIFYNGLHLEGKLSSALSQLAKTKTCIAVAESIATERLLYISEDRQPDPHIWFDVLLWADALESIAVTLAKFDPANSEVYHQQYQKYRKKLNDLDRQAKLRLAKIPKQQRVLVTAHDAFQYFGRAYGVELLAIQGVSTATDFGLYDLKRIVDTVIDREVKAVFIETSVSPKLVEALIAGANARKHLLKLGGELYSDALGEKGSQAETYIGMFQSNIDTIVTALN